MSENPFEQHPLQEVLHEIVDHARARMDDAGYTPAAAVLVVHVDVPGVGPIRTAAAFPIGEFEEHAKMCREGAEVFEAAGAVQPPMFKVVQDALLMRGWELRPTVGDSPVAPLYHHPRTGRSYASLEEAIMAQTFLEIADA